MDHGAHSLSQYMPHGHCYLWEPALVATHVISDLLIGLAYLSISISLYLLIRKIKMPFSPIVLAFGIFIGACGMTHFMEVWNLWNASYWLGGWVKVLTALASVYTCIALIKLSPKIIAFAEAAKLSEERGLKLETAYADMEARVKERTSELEIANARERKAKEQIELLYGAAQKANRLKDEFLATMSHELRTPLSVILGYSEMLEQGEFDEAGSKLAISTIRRNAKTQSQLVNDLLDVSMIISGKMNLDQKIINLSNTIVDAKASLDLAAKAKAIEIHVQDNEREAVVLGDPTRIQQIIWNLLSNAIKFTPKGGRIDITLSIEHSRCVIQVKDSGQGIDAAFLPFVFDRFRQEDSTSSRKSGGLGLGLGIARHLTELHGGAIEARSDGKDKGATFIVSLPLAALSNAGAAINVHVDLSTHERLTGIRILVIEDEKDVRDLVVTFLRKNKMVFEGADSAAAALAKMALFNPQVIVCDIGMPVTDGHTLMRMIRDQELNFGGFTPAIALTAFAHDGVREKVFASGFQGYLTKPAEGTALLAEIVRVLRS